MSQAVSRTPAALARRDLSARQAILGACMAMLAVIGLDLMIDGRLGLLFSIGFVLIAVTAPLAVDARSLLPTGVLPPPLLIGSLLLVSIIAAGAIQVDGLAKDAGVVARLIASVIDHGMTLVVGQALTLGIIALRVMSNPER